MYASNPRVASPTAELDEFDVGMNVDPAPAADPPAAQDDGDDDMMIDPALLAQDPPDAPGPSMSNDNAQAGPSGANIPSSANNNSGADGSSFTFPYLQNLPGTTRAK